MHCDNAKMMRFRVGVLAFVAWVGVGCLRKALKVATSESEPSLGTGIVASSLGTQAPKEFKLAKGICRYS